MTRWHRVLVFVAILATVDFLPIASRAQTASPLGGIWTLNRSLSEFPKEIGFNIDLSAADPETPPPSGGGRGRRGSGRAPSGNPFSGRRESYEDAQRVRLLTGEVRNPPTRLMIVDMPGAVTITNELGQSRTLHPTGREESVEIEGQMFQVTTRRDGDRLISLYHVEPDRDVSYTYSVAGTPRRLTVVAQFLDHGEGDKAARVYDSGVVTTPAATTSSAAPADGGSIPASGSRESFDQRPGAEFAGLKDVGILVEDLGPEAMACGLRHDAIEDALATRLRSGGLTVRKNSDEDTYVYVNVITTNLTSAATCVTRYDAFLYTQGTTKLSYHDKPVLAQVSLVHRGGMTAGAAISHSAAVVRALEGYIDIFLQQIHDANK